MRNHKINNILHIDGMESWQGYHSKGKLELLNKSWAGTFRTHILPNLPLSELSQYYSSTMGRPTKDLGTAMGAIVLQQIFDLTDSETREQLAFNQQWHYALDTYNPNDQLFSEKTLWTVRHHLTSAGTCQTIFNSVTDVLIKTFNVDTSKQRMDSVHVYSNMARLGRVRLIARTITLFLRNLKRNHVLEYATDITSDLKARYSQETSSGYFGNSKPSESQKRLTDIVSDLYWLVDQYLFNSSINSMHSYKLMQRVLSEQCLIKEGKVSIKPAKEVSSDSLQNPSDIDSGYDGHKGQGYQTQLAESYSRRSETEKSGETEKSKEEPVLNLITYTKTESADKSDSGGLQPAIENMEIRDIKPNELLVDSLYGGDDNVNQSKAKQVEIISPVMGKKSGKDYSGFKFDDKSKEVQQCPNGKSPEQTIRNKEDKITSRWSAQDCLNCPLKSNCQTKPGLSGRKLIYTKKELRLWERRQKESSPEFKDKYRYRSGIEGTNSRFIHMTGARRVRYRGLENVEFAETMKALGINMFRVAKYLIKKGIFVDSNSNIDLKTVIIDLKTVIYVKYHYLIDKITNIYEKYSDISFHVKYLSIIV